MKKAISVIFCFILIFTCASAHPGRTDASGGHWDRSTGEYHYHHGYPAHQHTNGICPYDYNDLTGSTSGSPSSSSSSVSATSVSVSYEGEPGDYGPEAEWEFETKRDAHHSGFEWGVEYSLDDTNPDSAYSQGYSEGYEQGAQDNYESAYEDGRDSVFSDTYDYAYDEGYDAGYSDGTTSGENTGYNTGYDDAEWKYQWIIIISGLIAIAITCLLVHSLRKVNGEFSQYKKQYDALREAYNKQGSLSEEERKKWSQLIQSQNSQIRSLQAQLAKRQTASKRTITFGNWPPSVHQNDMQFKRFQNSLDPRLKLICRTENGYKIQGGSGTYEATLNTCNCPDFLTNLHGQSPCKHIYFLARQCGIAVNSIFEDFPHDPK